MHGQNHIKYVGEAHLMLVLIRNVHLVGIINGVHWQSTISDVAVKQVALLFCILKVLGPNSSLETSSFDWGFSWFSSDHLMQLKGYAN